MDLWSLYGSYLHPRIIQCLSESNTRTRTPVSFAISLLLLILLHSLLARRGSVTILRGIHECHHLWMFSFNILASDADTRPSLFQSSFSCFSRFSLMTSSTGHDSATRGLCMSQLLWMTILRILSKRYVIIGPVDLLQMHARGPLFFSRIYSMLLPDFFSVFYCPRKRISLHDKLTKTGMH